VTALSDDAVARLREAALWPDLSGTRYTAIRPLGYGGMGTVYLARDEGLGREVAVKVAGTVSGDDDLTRRLGTEAGVLARLEHPGIVPIHDVGRLPDGRAYYVMKRVDGRTLAAWLLEPAPLAERLRIFERVCEPVAFAHARGLVHRDLKPDNIMVGSFGEVLVLDWGVAKDLGRDAPAAGGTGRATPPAGASGITQPGTVMGTPGFMSPEQAAGDVGQVDQRSDVYALGALLVQMLSGRAPEPGQSAAPPPPRPPGIPRRLRAIGAKAMSPSPGDRYPDAGALAADVARFRAGHAVAAYPESVLDRFGRVAGTYRTAILLVAAYLVMRVIVALLTG
jgi:serine/threonine protein kinase